MKAAKWAGYLVAGLVATGAAQATSIAVWLDGQTTSGGNAIPGFIDTVFGSGAATLVTTAQLETAGFLNSFDAVVVSRFDSDFGTYMSATAAANVRSYVGAPGPTQGGVAVFTNDMADNLPGSSSGDPVDPNLVALFKNALTNVAASHHGYIGEFNGAIMAMASNTAGAPAIGLLTGTASDWERYAPNQFTYGVGPIGAGHPIDAGVVFPFTDNDLTPFLTRITGADPNNVVDIYTSVGIEGLPAVLANGGGIEGNAPEPGTLALLGLGLAGLAATRRRKQ